MQKNEQKCSFLWILVLACKHDPLDREVTSVPHSIHFLCVCIHPGLTGHHPMSAPGWGHNGQTSSSGPTFRSTTELGSSALPQTQASPAPRYSAAGGLVFPLAGWGDHPLLLLHCLLVQTCSKWATDSAVCPSYFFSLEGCWTQRPKFLLTSGQVKEMFLFRVTNVSVFHQRTKLLHFLKNQVNYSIAFGFSILPDWVLTPEYWGSVGQVAFLVTFSLPSKENHCPRFLKIFMKAECLEQTALKRWKQIMRFFQQYDGVYAPDKHTFTPTQNAVVWTLETIKILFSFYF